MKKFDIKSILVGLVVGVSLFGCVNAASVLAENVYFSQFPIVVNGKSYTSGSAILNYMGSTYVSLKELGEITGSTVTFNNNTIYVNNKTTGNVNVNTNTNYYPTTSSYEIELEEDETENVFVNLAKYNAQSATVSYTNNCIYASKVYFNSNGTFTVHGVEEGSTTLTIRYDTGAVEYIYVTVEGVEEDEEELEIEVGDYEYIDIDLDDYDADKATLSITKGSSYITLGKTSVTKDTEVKVTGKKEGSATIKIKYDTGDIEYVYVEVVEDEDDDELEIEVDDYEYIKIDLDDYDADEATLSITKGSSYISLSKKKLTSDGSVKVTGDKEGSATIKIKYDTGDVEYVYVEVVDEDDDEYDYDDFDYEDELYVEVDDYEEFYIDLEDYDAADAEISIISGKANISLGKTKVTESQDIKIYGDDEGEAIVEIEFSTGEVIYLWIEVEE